MKFKKKEMKDALTVMKRLVKDNKKGKIFVEAKGDMRLYLKAVSDEGTCATYHVITSLNDETYAFSINPYDLDKQLTELDNALKKQVKDLKEQGEKAGLDKKEIKAEEKALREAQEAVEFKVNSKSITLVGGKSNFKVTPIEEDLHFYFEELTEAKHPESFINMLKEAETALKKNKDLNTSYLKITSEKALAAEEKQIHFFRVEEELPFKGGYLHKDNVSILAKSIKGSFQMGMKDDQFVLYHNDVYYLVKLENNIQFPSFRSMIPLNRDIAFRINCDEVNELLTQFKKTKEKNSHVTEILLSQQGNVLIFDPRNPEYPILEMPIVVVEGSMKRAIFENEILRSFFGAYQGEIQVEQQQFKNVYGVHGYMWRIYTPEKLTMISGIEEPDWEVIEQHFKEGTIKELVHEKEALKD